jgi:aubergine
LHSRRVEEPAPSPEREPASVAAGQREASRSIPAKAYVTKPGDNSKQGSSGTPVSLSANYFRLIRKPEFEFNLYRVDFFPSLELAPLKKRFIYEQREIFGGYLFDGDSLIYLTRRLDSEKKEFECESREGEKYRMVVKNTGTKIEMTDGMAMQILNLILRKTMDGLKMQEVGRNLYDPENKVSLVLRIICQKIS